MARPAPNPTDELRPFWEGLRRAEFLLPRCDRCGKWRWPPAGCRAHPNAPYLANLHWTLASGSGTVFAYTIQQIPFDPSFPVPYAYALIELDEGPVMVSNVVGCEPQAVHIGMRVRVVFEPSADGYAIPLFTPNASEHTSGEDPR